MLTAFFCDMRDRYVLRLELRLCLSGAARAATCLPSRGCIVGLTMMLPLPVTCLRDVVYVYQMYTLSLKEKNTVEYISWAKWTMICVGCAHMSPKSSSTHCVTYISIPRHRCLKFSFQYYVYIPPFLISQIWIVIWMNVACCDEFELESD